MYVIKRVRARACEKNSRLFIPAREIYFFFISLYANVALLIPSPLVGDDKHCSLCTRRTFHAELQRIYAGYLYTRARRLCYSLLSFRLLYTKVPWESDSFAQRARSNYLIHAYTSETFRRILPALFLR